MEGEADNQQNSNHQDKQLKESDTKEVIEKLTKSCSEIVRNIILNSAYFNAFLLLVILIQASHLSYIYLISFLWLFDAYEVIKQVVFLRCITKNIQAQHPACEAMKRRAKFQILDCIVGFSFKLCIVLYEEQIFISTMTTPSAIGFGYFALRIISNIVCPTIKRDTDMLQEETEGEGEANVAESLQVLEAQQQTNSFYFIINNWIFRVYFVTQALFYSLKTEEQIDWSWNEVFWVFWVFFCVLVGIALIIFLLLVVKICDYLAGSPKETPEIVGLFWFFLIMVLISYNSYRTVLQCCTMLINIDNYNTTEGKSSSDIVKAGELLETTRQGLHDIVYIIAIGFGIQLIYYVILRKRIHAFVKLIMFEFDEEEEMLGTEKDEGDEEGAENPRNQDNRGQRGGHRGDSESDESPQKKVRMAYKSKFVLEESKVQPAMNLPQFVSKVSSTYFKLLTGGKDLEKEVAQKKKEKMLNQKKKKDNKIKKEILPESKVVVEQKLQQQRQRLKNKRNPKGSSMKSLNRSAAATITLTTQGALNTQADMLESFRGTDQNDLEDVFQEENNNTNQGGKKDPRADNNTKKNTKAMNKQRFFQFQETDIESNPSNTAAVVGQVKDGTSTKPSRMVINLDGIGIRQPNGSNEDGQLKKIQRNKEINYIKSPIKGEGESPMFSDMYNKNENTSSNNRRHISVANVFKYPSGDQMNPSLNMTAPFRTQTHPYDGDYFDNYGIKEEGDNENHDSYFEDSYQGNKNQKQIQKQSLVPEHETITLSEDSHRQQSESILSLSQQQSVVNCLVCFDAQPDSIFNPCGHGGLCYECAIDLLKKTAECFLCRTKIDEVLKIDLESKSMGIMKILTSTKFIKVREKIEISEQEYQYYSALQRGRRNMAGIIETGAAGAQPLPLQPLPQHSSQLQLHRLPEQNQQEMENHAESGQEQGQIQQQQLRNEELPQNVHQLNSSNPPSEVQQSTDEKDINSAQQCILEEVQQSEEINSGRVNPPALKDNQLPDK